MTETITVCYTFGILMTQAFQTMTKNEKWKTKNNDKWQALTNDSKRQMTNNKHWKRKKNNKRQTTTNNNQRQITTKTNNDKQQTMTNAKQQTKHNDKQQMTNKKTTNDKQQTKKPPLTNDHQERPAPCSWSSWYMNRTLANDHSERPSSYKWSSGWIGLLQMIMMEWPLANDPPFPYLLFFSSTKKHIFLLQIFSSFSSAVYLLPC